MLGRAYVLAAQAALWVSAGTAAQDDLRQLLAVLPDEALAVAAAAAPATAARSLTAVLEPMPEGVPPELVARIGIGLAAVRVALGGSTAEWLQRVAGGGAALAVLPATRAGGFDVLVVTRPPDLAAAVRWCARHPERVHHAVVGEHLLLASSQAGVELLRARSAGPAGRWAASELATAAAATRGFAAQVDLEALRRLLGPRAPQLDRLGGAARFVLAPIVHALADAPWLLLDVAAEGERLHVDLRAAASVRDTPFAALLGGVAGQAVPPMLPADGLLSLRLDRSFRALLGDPERFLAPDEVLAVQGFLSIADAFDGARSSFVDDLLGGLREPFTLQVLSPAEGAADRGDEPTPIVLPEFALAAGVGDPGVGAVLLRAAQVLATIVNAERGQRGEAPFVVRRRRDESGQGLVAEPPPWRGPGAAPLDRQLSPTLWIGADRVALASTQRAAQAIVARAPAPPGSGGDLLLLHGPAIGAAVAGSRSALALGRVLDEGEGFDEAQQVIDTLVAFAGAVAELRAQVTVDAASTRARLELERRR